MSHQPRLAESPSDEMVAAWRLPARVRRVPPTAWLIIVVALLDAGVRASWVLPTIWPGDARLFLRSIFASAENGLLVALPAAVLLGPTVGSARRILLVGAGAMAAAELASLALELFPIRTSDPLLMRPHEVEIAIRMAGLLVAALAPAALALGILRTSPYHVQLGGSPRAWTVLTVAVLAAVAQTAVVVHAIAFHPGVPSTLDAVAVITAMSTPPTALGWGLLAAVALGARRPARPWRLLAAATLLMLTAQAATATLAVLAIPFAARPGFDVSAWFFAGHDVVSAVHIVGLALLVAALASGPRRTESAS